MPLNSRMYEKEPHFLGVQTGNDGAEWSILLACFCTWEGMDDISRLLARSAPIEGLGTPMLLILRIALAHPTRSGTFAKISRVPLHEIHTHRHIVYVDVHTGIPFICVCTLTHAQNPLITCAWSWLLEMVGRRDDGQVATPGRTRTRDASWKMADCEKEEAHNLVSYLPLLSVYLIVLEA